MMTTLLPPYQLGAFRGLDNQQVARDATVNLASKCRICFWTPPYRAEFLLDSFG